VQVLHQPHEYAVAGRAFLLEILLRDVPEQSAGALDLQTVGEQTHLDVAAAYVRAVISMSDGVQDGLPHGLFGILQHIPAKQPVDETALADARQNVVDGLGDHLGNRSLELPVVQESFAARRLLGFAGAVELNERDDQLRQELLRVLSEGQ